MRCRAAITAAAGLAPILAGSPAAAHVPPPPPNDASFIASCSSTEIGIPDPVGATVTPLTDTPVVAKSAGPLALRWGVRVTTDDPRVDDLTSLAFSNAYGLLATTARGNWLTLDLQGGSLAGVKAVGVAPIRGASGRPTSIADLYGSLSFVAFANKAGMIARIALSTCGTNATAVPWLTTQGTVSPFVIQAAYTYLGIVAPDAAHGDTLLLPYEKKTIALPAAENPFVSAGERLVALNNPTRIVPYVLALTRPSRGPGATMRLVYHEAWSDVRGSPPIPTRTLLHVTRTPSAMASSLDKTGVTTVILAFPADAPGTIDLYRFDGKL